MKKILPLLVLLLFCSNNIKKEHYTRRDKKSETHTSKSILIGDSNVGVIKLTNGFKSSGVDIGPYKSGITTSGLIDILGQSVIDTSHNIIFVAIGTNDIYQTNNSSYLKKQIKIKYPRVSDIYVIWGSRGWGGVKNITIVDQDLFYNRFEFNRFKVIRITSGNFKNDTLAHTPNQKYQLEIVEKMKKITDN